MSVSFEKIFDHYQSYVKVDATQQLKHPLLMQFKPSYYEVKLEGEKIVWYPYDLYLSDLRNYYKKYYGLKQIKQNDSTLKALLEAFKTQVEYYTLKFTTGKEYNIILKP